MHRATAPDHRTGAGCSCERFEHFEHLVERWPFRWLPRQHARDQLRDLLRDVGRDLAQRLEVLQCHVVQNLEDVVPRGRAYPGKALVEHDPERPDIGSVIDLRPGRLLGCHVPWRPPHDTGRVSGRAPRFSVERSQLGDPEIEDLDGA